MLQAKALENQGDFSGALAAYQQLESAVLSGTPITDKDRAQLYHKLGLMYCYLNDIPNGRAYTLQAIDLWRKLYGEVCDSYITSLNNYSSTYGMEQNFVEALRLQKQVLSLCDRLDHQHPNYGLYLLNGG
jgi:tetratricopeptide (TPR) repeat protein